MTLLGAGLDLFQAMVVVLEVILVLALGFFAGKVFHDIFTNAFSSIAKNTKTQLDDIILQYIEKPLELILIVSLLFVISSFVENLSFINQTISNYLYSILALLGAYLLSEVVGAVLKWSYVSNKAKAIDITLLPFARKLSRLIILFFGITIALSAVGIDITGVLAVTSVVGIIIGLASQETLSNIFAGLALQIDRPYVYNEHLRLVTGEVLRLKKIGVRSTKLEDNEGNIVVMSNSEFAKQRIINLSRRQGGHAGSAFIEFPLSVKREQAFLVAQKKMEEKAKNGIAGTKFEASMEKVAKDSFVVSVSFECRNYEDIARVRSDLNLAALDFVQKNQKQK